MTPYIEYELEKITNNYRATQGRIARVATLRELKLLSVPVPAMFKSLMRSTASRFEHARAQKASELVDAQLAVLKDLPWPEGMALDQFKQILGERRRHFLQTEWLYLRGDFPRQYHKAMTESERIVYQRTR